MNSSRISIWLLLVAIFVLFWTVAAKYAYDDPIVVLGGLIGLAGILVGLFGALPSGDITE